jgi:hypothetical protein
MDREGPGIATWMRSPSLPYSILEILGAGHNGRDDHVWSVNMVGVALDAAIIGGLCGVTFRTLGTPQRLKPWVE